MISEAKFYAELGRLLLAKRREKGLTQEALAEMVGLTRTSVTNIEKGRQKVLSHVLVELAQALDTNVNELLPKNSVASNPLDSLPPAPRRWIEETLSPE